MGNALPDLREGSWPLRFARGFALSFQGFTLTVRNKWLMALVVLPMLIQLATFVGALWAASVYGAQWCAWLNDEACNTEMLVLGALAVLVLAVVSAWFVGTIVVSPIYDVISEETERTLQNPDPPPFPSPWVALRSMALEFVRDLLRLAVFFAVSIPLAGSVVGMPLQLMWSWLWAAYVFIARPAFRHHLGFRDRIRLLTNNPPASLGYGLGAWLLMFVPMSAPFLVVSGTQLFVALRAGNPHVARTPPSRIPVRAP